MASELDEPGRIGDGTARGGHSYDVGGGPHTNTRATVPPTQTVAGTEVSERRGGRGFSRREMLKRVGIMGAAAAVPVGGLTPAAAAAPARRTTSTAPSLAHSRLHARRTPRVSPRLTPTRRPRKARHLPSSRCRTRTPC